MKMLLHELVREKGISLSFRGEENNKFNKFIQINHFF